MFAPFGKRAVSDAEAAGLGLQVLEQGMQLLALRQSHPLDDPLRAEIEAGVVRWQALQRKVLAFLEAHRETSGSLAN